MMKTSLRVCLVLGCLQASGAVAATFTVTSNADSGAGTLREAAQLAEDNPGLDNIHFNLPVGSSTIMLFSGVLLTSPVFVDGLTQPDSSCSGSLPVRLVGNQSGFAFIVFSDGSTIRGLTMHGFSTAIVVHGESNTIQCNRLGTTVDGTAIGTPPSFEGIAVFGDLNLIGTDGDGVNDPNEGNQISGNTNYGISMNTVDGTRIAGNTIGADPTGNMALPNGDGINQQQSTNSRIGTDGNGISDAEERNLISGNTANGVSLVQGGNGTWIAGNRIGTNRAGTAALSNGSTGVSLDRVNGVLVGTNGDGAFDTNERNLISGDSFTTLYIISASNCQIKGNYVGTNAAGTASLGGSFNVALGLGSTGNIIGTDGDGNGFDANEGNLISGNRGLSGVLLNHTGTNNNRIAGNRIGTNAAGTVVIPGVGVGVLVQGGTGNIVGTNGDGVADDLEGNWIVGNGLGGVSLTGSGTSGNVVAGNWIGTDPTGTLNLGNAGPAIRIGSDSSNNRIGTNLDNTSDVLEGNRMRFNRRGVVIQGTAATGNRIRGNSIDGNSLAANELGIDLGNDGVTANDANDVDSGPNRLQNAPVLDSAANSGGNTIIMGSLHSSASTAFLVEFFSSPACHESGFGEGRTFLGRASFTTSASGTVATNLSIPALTSGTAITTTATQVTSGDTSEFSNCVVVSAFPAPTATFTMTPTRTRTATVTSTRTITLTPTRTRTATVTSTRTSTFTPTRTRTSTATPVPPTLTLTPTITSTPTRTRTATVTATRTITMTPTRTRTSTATPVPPTFTLTPTLTLTPTRTRTATGSPTRTSTFTPTRTRTRTATPVPPTLTNTPTVSSTATRTRTATGSPTRTSTLTPTRTRTSTATSLPPTITSTPTVSATATRTPTGTQPATFTPTGAQPATFTPTGTPTGTQPATFTPTGTQPATFTPTGTQPATFTPTGTQPATFTPTGTQPATFTPTGTQPATFTPTGTRTATELSTVTSTPTGTLSASPTTTASPTSTQPGATSTPTSTASAPGTSTATPSSTPTGPGSTATWTPATSSTPTPTATVSAPMVPAGSAATGGWALLLAAAVLACRRGSGRRLPKHAGASS